MLKIGPRFQNINKRVNRYLWKNTTRARYNRCMDLMTFSGIAAGAQFCKFSTWDVVDAGIMAGLVTTTYIALGKALKHLIHLQPIRKRAIRIKKAAKLNTKI